MRDFYFSNDDLFGKRDAINSALARSVFSSVSRESLMQNVGAPSNALYAADVSVQHTGEFFIRNANNVL